MRVLTFVVVSGFSVPAQAVTVNLAGTLNLPAGYVVRDIDLQGSTALIGGAGSALVYDLNADAVTRTFLPFDGAPDLAFGSAVAMDGARYIVGAPYSNYKSRTGVGAAYIYDMSGPLTARRLDPSESFRSFGQSVDIDGDRAVVAGSMVWDGGSWIDEGAAFIYDAATGLEQRKLTMPGNAEVYAVAIGEGIVAAGDRYGQISLSDAETGASVGAYDVWYSHVSDIAIEGGLVLAGATDGGWGVATLWNRDTGTRVSLPEIPEDDQLDNLFGGEVGLSGSLLALSDPAWCDSPGRDGSDYGPIVVVCGETFGAVGLYSAVDGSVLARINSPDYTAFEPVFLDRYSDIQLGDEPNLYVKYLALAGEEFGQNVALDGRTLLVSNAFGTVFRYEIFDDLPPAPVPGPAAGWALVTALGALGAARSLRRRSA